MVLIKVDNGWQQLLCHIASLLWLKVWGEYICLVCYWLFNTLLVL